MRQAEKNLRHVIRETLLLLEVTENGFRSLVLGTGSKWAGNENEAIIRKKTIGDLINAGSDQWATLKNLAKIIVDNDLYQISSSPGNDVRPIWAGFLDADALQREIVKLRRGAEYREPSSERSSTIDAAVVFENLEKIRKIQLDVYLAVIELTGKEIMIPRSSGRQNLAKFFYFDPSSNQIHVKWEEGKSNAEKDLYPVEVVNLNLMYAKPLTILSGFDPKRTFLSYDNQAALVYNVNQFHFGPSVTSSAELHVLDTPYSDLMMDGQGYYNRKTRSGTFLKAKVKIKSMSEIENLVRQNPWLATRSQTSY